MSGLGRYVRVLRLFDEVRGAWTVPEIAAALDVPASTAYRTVREMVASDVLEPAPDAHYRLGALFIEYDRLIRVTDPLHAAGLPLLREAAARADVACFAVLARLHGDTVMCVADAATPGAARTSYERGRPRPLTRGATSKAILAQLPARRLARLIGDGPRLVGREDPHAALRAELAAIRRRGFAVTRGEVDPGVVGIGAPVRLPEHGLVGSLSLVAEAATVDDATERRLVLLVVSVAGLLQEAMTRDPEAGARRAAR